jgi:hypothetical protein
VHVVKEEDPLPEPGYQPVQVGPGQGRGAGHGALQRVHDPGLVPFRLEAPDEPAPRVAQPLVVQVHRVLRGQEHPHAVRPRLLEQREHGRLGRRVRRRWEEPENLVHVDQRTQARRPALAPHPREDLVEEHGHEEHALVVAQVGDGEDGDAGGPVRGVQEGRHVQRLAFHPGLEARGRQDPVQTERQVEAVLRRVEALQFHDAHPGEWWPLDRLDEVPELQGTAVLPRVLEDAGQEDVLAAPDGIRLDPQERQQAGHRGLDPLPQRVRVREHRLPGDGERAEHGNLSSRRAPRCVYGEIGVGPEPADPLPVLAPARQPAPPQLRLGLGERRRVQAALAGHLLVHPGPEVGRGQVRERQKEVRQVALRVDGDHGDPVHGRLLHDPQRQPRLAAPRHPDDDPVGREVPGVVQQEVLGALAGGRITDPAEIEGSELLEPRLQIVHGDPPPSMSPPRAFSGSE